MSELNTNTTTNSTKETIMTEKKTPLIKVEFNTDQMKDCFESLKTKASAIKLPKVSVPKVNVAKGIGTVIGKVSETAKKAPKPSFKGLGTYFAQAVADIKEGIDSVNKDDSTSS